MEISDARVDGISAAVKSFITSMPRGGGKASTLNALPDYAARLKERIDTELRILENESKLPRREPAGMIHITAGNGSNVVIGDVSNSILTTLQRGSNEELNKVLAQLTEAIRQTNEIATETKAEILQNLEFIVSEISAEPAKRQKLTVIQAVWNSLAPMLATAANLAQLYSTAAPLLMHHLMA
jgi:hypothetical protein